MVFISYSAVSAVLWLQRRKWGQPPNGKVPKNVGHKLKQVAFANNVLNVYYCGAECYCLQFSHHSNIPDISMYIKYTSTPVKVHLKD